jgi:hypothetical protein
MEGNLEQTKLNLNDKKSLYLYVNFFAEKLWRRVGVDQKSTSGFVVATRPMHFTELGFHNVDPGNPRKKINQNPERKCYLGFDLTYFVSNKFNTISMFYLYLSGFNLETNSAKRR